MSYLELQVSDLKTFLVFKNKISGNSFCSRPHVNRRGSTELDQTVLVILNHVTASQVSAFITSKLYHVLSKTVTSFEPIYPV